MEEKRRSPENKGISSVACSSYDGRRRYFTPGRPAFCTKTARPAIFCRRGAPPA